MELVATQDVSTLSVAQICRGAGVHRASFYRHFEDIDDLEDRFLHLYFQKTVQDGLFFPRSTEELSHLYQKIVVAMRDQSSFFGASFEVPRLGQFSERWRSLIGSWLQGLFCDPPQGVNSSLWRLHLEFSRGVIYRYCELGFRNDTGVDLPELTRRTMEFQWGGLAYLRESHTRGSPATLPGLDEELRTRSWTRARGSKRPPVPEVPRRVRSPVGDPPLPH